MKRALVLGGGGAVGIAWETGVVAGLLDEGIDVRIADLVVGTSAGSVVGTSLALGRDPRDLLQQAARASNGTPPRRPADPDAAMAVFRMWGRIQKFTDEEFAEVGR
ncbi:MAG: patatin-like phospholipase family protein, partial [Chloroflexi bacterium]|nr:patatin-like phospholipase family protein [Chloroflexota bacterium]